MASVPQDFFSGRMHRAAERAVNEIASGNGITGGTLSRFPAEAGQGGECPIRLLARNSLRPVQKTLMTCREQSRLALRKSNYQTLQTLSAGFTIGRPALQENARENSGMFTSTPLIRYFAAECGSVMAGTRRSS